jgi:hypothetical protein
MRPPSDAAACPPAPLSSRNSDDLYALLTPICHAGSNLVEPDGDLRRFHMAIDAECLVRPPRPHFTRPTFDDSICFGGSCVTGKMQMVDESLLRDRIERFKPVGRIVLSLVKNAFTHFDQCHEVSKPRTVRLTGLSLWRAVNSELPRCGSRRVKRLIHDSTPQLIQSSRAHSMRPRRTRARPPLNGSLLTVQRCRPNQAPHSCPRITSEARFRAPAGKGCHYFASPGLPMRSRTATARAPATDGAEWPPPWPAATRCGDERRGKRSGTWLVSLSLDRRRARNWPENPRTATLKGYEAVPSGNLPFVRLIAFPGVQ